jgi:hypothetical protein
MTLDRYHKSTELLTQRLSLIRALYIVSVASGGPPDEIRREFHQAVGDVLEGINLPSLSLIFIDRTKVNNEAAWLREKS